MQLRQACCALFVVAGCAPAATQEAKPIPPTPLADHHKHVTSPAAAAYAKAAGRIDFTGDVQSITAAQLVAELDAAGIRQAVVLSVAYWFGSPNLAPVENEYAKVRAENDWTTQQARRFPARLVPFCSVNPLNDYALEEINRCATQLMVKGLKLHFNGSGVDLLNFRHAATLRRVFQAVNERRLAMVVHVRGDLAVYGREHAEKFLDLLSAARDVPVQIAHLWGGEGFSDAALATYASAVSNGDARTKNLYFDVADTVRFVRGPRPPAAWLSGRFAQSGRTGFCGGVTWRPQVRPHNRPGQRFAPRCHSPRMKCERSRVTWRPTCSDVVHRTGVDQAGPASQTFASWNRMTWWMHQVERLRAAT